MLKDLTSLSIKNKIVNSEVLKDFKVSEPLRMMLNSSLEKGKYIINDYTSYTETERSSSNTAIIPNQYFILACEMFELATELHKYFEVFEELRHESNFLLGSADQIEANFNTGLITSKKIKSPSDIALFSKFLDKNDSKYRLDGKRLVDDKGKPRGARDCFGSVILKSINLPDSSSSIFGSLVYDLAEVEPTYNELRNAYLQQKENLVKEEPQEREQIAVAEKLCLSKPFILLAGISGTGKTRFVRQQAQRSASDFELKKGENYCLVPVRPDWHEPSDLLGYISRLDGVRYVTTDFLKFVFKALSAAISDIDGSNIIWKTPSEIPPYWLCLDEMNLAPVEQYFADYLSIIETREWAGYAYHSEALLKKGVFDSLKPEVSYGGNYSTSEPSSSALTLFFNEVFAGIAITTELKNKIITYITNSGLPLPPNLIVAGTVNMDETTHGFSRKVIDRALTFDFGEFFPNDFDSFFTPKSEPVLLSYPTNSGADKAALQSVSADSTGEKSIAFLKSINKILYGTPFELAYRALNELLLSVVSFSPTNDTELQAVWDDFMMCKVLPRVDGDNDKLAVVETLNFEGTILDQLESQLREQLSIIWDEAVRPDLLRESTESDLSITIECRSKKKLSWMKARLEKNTFTSFWP